MTEKISKAEPTHESEKENSNPPLSLSLKNPSLSLSTNRSLSLSKKKRINIVVMLYNTIYFFRFFSFSLKIFLKKKSYYFEGYIGVALCNFCGSLSLEVVLQFLFFFFISPDDEF